MLITLPFKCITLPVNPRFELLPEFSTSVRACVRCVDDWQLISVPVPVCRDFSISFRCLTWIILLFLLLHERNMTVAISAPGESLILHGLIYSIIQVRVVLLILRYVVIVIVLCDIYSMVAFIASINDGLFTNFRCRSASLSSIISNAHACCLAYIYTYIHPS
jgi:hypothetical protein